MSSAQSQIAGPENGYALDNGTRLLIRRLAPFAKQATVAPNFSHYISSA